MKAEIHQNVTLPLIFLLLLMAAGSFLAFPAPDVSPAASLAAGTEYVYSCKVSTLLRGDIGNLCGEVSGEDSTSKCMALGPGDRHVMSTF